MAGPWRRDPRSIQCLYPCCGAGCPRRAIRGWSELMLHHRPAFIRAVEPECPRSALRPRTQPPALSAHLCSVFFLKAFSSRLRRRHTHEPSQQPIKGGHACNLEHFRQSCQTWPEIIFYSIVFTWHHGGHQLKRHVAFCVCFHTCSFGLLHNKLGY